MSFQLWTNGGETCPQGTIPIRRTTEKDMLRASSHQRFGRKRRRTATRAIRRDATSSSDHEVFAIHFPLFCSLTDSKLRFVPTWVFITCYDCEWFLQTSLSKQSTNSFKTNTMHHDYVYFPSHSLLPSIDSSWGTLLELTLQASIWTLPIFKCPSHYWC